MPTMPIQHPETEYRGYTIIDQSATSRMVCPVHVHGLRMPNSPTVEEAKRRIDAYLERQAAGGLTMTILSIGGERGIKASTCRQRTEIARGRQRKSGKFA